VASDIGTALFRKQRLKIVVHKVPLKSSGIDPAFVTSYKILQGYVSMSVPIEACILSWRLARSVAGMVRTSFAQRIEIVVTC
jgi:hypothetical protein